MTEIVEYWGPEDSSIRFCEKNYDNSKYIAEYYNTLTAFFSSLVGLYFLLISGSKLKKNTSYAMIALGFTTALFHGTMRYYGQWSDEISMIFLSFMLIKEVHDNLSYLFLGGMIVVYLMYWDTFIVFFLMFIGMQTYLYLLSMKFRYIKGNNKLFMMKEGCIYLSMLCWVLDHLFCSNYEYFHAFWHILTSMTLFFGAKILENYKKSLLLKSE